MATGGVNFEYFGDGGTTVDGVQGDVYLDGSCTRHIVPELQRAGWAVVQLGDSGDMVARVFGPVWRPLPQTPQAAEFCAYAAATELLLGPSTLYDDCSNVVAAAKKPVAEALSWRRPNAGIIKASFRHASRNHVIDVLKVKGHVDEAAVEDPVLKRHARGNAFADEAAKLGVLEHPVLARVDTSIEAYVRELRAVAKVIANVGGLWPRANATKGRASMRTPRVRAQGASGPAVILAQPTDITHGGGPESHATHYMLSNVRYNFCGLCGLRAPHALATPCRRKPGSVRARRQLGDLMRGVDPVTGMSIQQWANSGEEVQ